MTNYLGLKTYYASIATKMLKSRGFKARTWKGQVKITLPKGTTNFKIDTPNTLLSLINLADSMFKPKEALYEEPPDAAIMNRSGKFPEEKLPEGYARYILPAGKNIGGKKVNIDRIKEWVQKVKMSGKTNEDVLNEYNELNGRERTTALSPRQRHALADSIALKVARKIWYVGRRPSELTDWDWNEMTKRMRPPKGSYSRNEKWTNVKFPYTQAYVYRSGA